MSTDSLEWSRPLKFGAGVTADAVALPERLENTLVNVSVDSALPGAINTAAILVETLARIIGSVNINDDGLTRGVAERLQAAGSDLPARVTSGRGSTASQVGPVIDIHVGTGRRSGMRVIPDGYGAQFAADPDVLLSQARASNALGHMTAAAIAAAEVFKVAADVVEARRVDHQHLAFCPVSLGPDTTIAADLKQHEMVVLLGGNGAIGTATARIISDLPLCGVAIAVDRQAFAIENVGTYSLGRRADAVAARHKTELVASVLGARWTTHRFEGSIDELPALIDAGVVPWPDVVLAAFDDDNARRDAQRVQADRLIDAGTGETFAGIQDCLPTGPCVRCYRPVRADSGPDDLAALARATGLEPSYLRVDGVVTEADIDTLDAEHRRIVAPHVGKARCALAAAIGLTGRTEDAEFQASIPFVSQLAACLQVGRLVAMLTGTNPSPAEIQFDVLLGPQLIDPDERDPSPSCLCQTRKGTTSLLREERRARRSLLQGALPPY